LAEGIPPGYVRQLAVDRANRLWFSASPQRHPEIGQPGLVADGKVRLFAESDGWNGAPVTAIAAAPSGDVWIGTARGVQRFGGGRFHTCAAGDGWPDEPIAALLFSRDGTLWIGTDSGLTQRPTGASRQSHEVPIRAVTAIAEDTAGRLWIGTSGGLIRYDGGEWTSMGAPHGHAAFPPETIRVDRRGRVWLGNARGMGACCFDGESFVPVTSIHGLPCDDVADLLPDAEGGVVFACRCGGVARMDAGGIRQVSDLPVSEAATRSPDGGVWWASGTQVFRLPGSTARPFLTFNDDILALHADSRGRLWIGTTARLWALVDTTGTKEPRMVRFSGDEDPGVVRTIGEDRSGTVWFGTETKGMFFYDDCEDVAMRASAPDAPAATHLLHGSSGRIWTAGHGSEGELTCADGLQNRLYTIADGLPGFRVTCMLEDRAGTLWIGTEGGLTRFDGVAFRNYGVEEGLAGRYVRCLAQDSRGQIWIGFLGGGISRFDGRNFQALTTGDGLPSSRIAGILESADGAMAILTYGGVCQYSPGDATAPWVAIDGLDADRRYAPDERIRVPESVTALRIRFHGVSLRTRRMRYAYVLEGADTDWRTTWDEEVRYENLRTGEYTFRVVAINRDLAYSEQAAVLRIAVVPDAREAQLRELARNVNGLRGLLAVCSRCKRIRNDRGEWEQVEVFVSERTRADFSHGYCPHCAAEAVRAIREPRAPP
jgi:ligand-binding sensor domain-containing protein